ncbi:MAG: hypothetical protein P8Z39_06780 [Gammaproteobacteria bacterium]
MKSLNTAIVTLIISIITTNAWSAPFNPGDIFISVSTPDDGTVYKIAGNGTVSTFATGLSDPVGLSFSPTGQLYVVERDSGEITNITAGGDFTSSPAYSWGFSSNDLRNLVIDSSGRMLVANRNDGTVVDVTGGGSHSSAPIFASGLSGTRDVFQTSTGIIYAVEENSGEVTDITSGGDFTGATPFASGFTLPYALAESPNGNLYLAEVLSGNVYDITLGGSGSPLFASNLDLVDEIIFDNDGTFLAVQEYLNTIVDISAGGSGPYDIFASGLGQYPQQIAIAPSSVPLPGAVWLLFSGLLPMFLTRFSNSRNKGVTL